MRGGLASGQYGPRCDPGVQSHSQRTEAAVKHRRGTIRAHTAG
jgi:hypothetical protein